MTIRSIVLSALFVFIAAPVTAQTSAEPDTTFYLSPYIVSPTQAKDRETPASFSTVSRDQIRSDFTSKDVPDLLSGLPSVTSYSESGNGIGYSYINLRGFTQKRLSVMINGVPQNDPEDHDVYWVDVPDLLDQAGTMQVQRGAGSAFYGPPAIGGSINIVTNPFAEKPGITLESDFGFQEYADSSSSLPLTSRRYSVALNSGLVDHRYMFYGKLGSIQSEGYRAHSWTNQTSWFLGAVRLDGDVSTRFHFFGGPLSDALTYTGLPKFVGNDPVLRRSNWGDWNTDSSWVNYSSGMRRFITANGADTVYAIPRRSVEEEEFSQPHIELINDWKISPGLTLMQTLFYYQGSGYYDYDGSWADSSTLRIGSAYGIPATENPTNALVRAFVGNRQIGWLPRIEIDHTGGTVTLGAELRFHRSTHWGAIRYADNLPPGFNPDYHFYEYNGEKDILSFYIHELYHLNEQTTLIGDLQLVRNRYRILNEKFLGNDFNVPYFFANPRIGINWNITDEWNSYCTVAWTSREPRLRNLYAAEDSYFGATPQFAQRSDGSYDVNAPFAQPEHLLDFELGAGYRSDRIRLSADVYWMEFSDELISNGQVDIFGQPVTGNAERTRHIGLEGDGAVAIARDLEIGGNISLSSNKLIKHRVFVESTDTSGNTVYVPQNLDGNPIGGFPSLLGNLHITWKSAPVAFTLSAKYVGSFYTDNFNLEENQNSDYTVVNCEASWKLPSFGGTSLTIRGAVSNLFNRLYFTNGDGNAFYPAAERSYRLGLRAEI
jgi:iron complex outermembrane recepter protein